MNVTFPSYCFCDYQYLKKGEESMTRISLRVSEFKNFGICNIVIGSQKVNNCIVSIAGNYVRWGTLAIMNRLALY